MNRKTSTEIIKIKNLKKNGSIDSKVIDKISSAFQSGYPVLVPVDCMYGLLVPPELADKKIINRRTSKKFVEDAILLVSDYKMAASSAHIDSLSQLDFLRRIWPGEVNVSMKQKEKNTAVVMRMPRSCYIHDVINNFGAPVHFMPAAYTKENLFRENEIIQAYEGFANLIVIIDEFCKEHIAPSHVDISDGTLKIIKEGRIASEEIKSYFYINHRKNQKKVQRTYYSLI